MSHSLTKIWIHAIFGTKNRMPLINDNISKLVHEYIQKQLEDLGCNPRIINGTADHIHMLFLISREKTIVEIIKNIKGGSSHWINQEELIKLKFSWQIGYGAYSVSESNVLIVEKYIRNQKEHHRKMTYKEEYDKFMSSHELGINH